jgi:hypothetical protein
LSLDKWFNRLLEQTGDHMPPLLEAGCKLDMAQVSFVTSTEQNRSSDAVVRAKVSSQGLYRQVSQSEAEAWARSHQALGYFETSSKENINVARVFQLLATSIAQCNAPIGTVQRNGKPLVDKKQGLAGHPGGSEGTRPRSKKCYC